MTRASRIHPQAMGRAVVLFLLAAASTLACGPRSAEPDGQILLYVNTDAPLPPPPGTTLAATDPIPLFDRVRIEIFRPGESSPCPGCTHEFDLDRDLVGQGRASAGIVTTPGVSGYVARVRIFRGELVDLGEPRPDATLETVVKLPATEVTGVHAITAVLHTDDVAHPVGSLAAPVAPEEGSATTDLAGSWPRARRVACAGDPGPGEVCVPGGAYWMGDTETRLVPVGSDPLVMRIAVVAPFFLDATEVTVGAFRASHLAKKNDPLPLTPNAGTPVVCPYTPNALNREDLPLTCVSWDQARAYCLAKGSDLPTEAQFELAASHLGTSAYVWGDDAPGCDDAVYGRGANLPDVTCPGFGPAAPASGLRDALVLDGGTIYDLAGNVTEYALDLWNRSDEPCWGTGVVEDPLCATPSSDFAYAPHTTVGGWWYGAGGTLSAGFRQPAYDFRAAAKGGPNGGLYAFPATATGFRCARDASP